MQLFTSAKSACLTRVFTLNSHWYQRSRILFEIPDEGTLQALFVAHIVHAERHCLRTPLQCSIWERTFTYYHIAGNKYKRSVTTHHFHSHPICKLEGQLCRLICIDNIAKMFKRKRFRNKALDATILGEVKTKSYKTMQTSSGTRWTYKYSCFRHFPKRTGSHWRKNGHACISCAYTQTHTLYLCMHVARFLLCTE